MGDLLAKIKRRNNLVKVLSGIELFQTPSTLSDSIVYDPRTLIEDEEWYKIENFSSRDFAPALILEEYVTVNHNQIVNADYSKVDYLCAIQNSQYFFQKISSNQILTKKLLKFSREPEILTNQPLIVLNNEADAIYDKSIDVLYFKKLVTLKSLFKGSEALYREATSVETQLFLDSDFLDVSEDFNADSVKVPNRKRIALVIDTLNGMSAIDKGNICAYIQGYCSSIPFADGKFGIATEEDLKLVLFGIEERFYTTPRSNQKRIANSIISL